MTKKLIFEKMVAVRDILFKNDSPERLSRILSDIVDAIDDSEDFLEEMPPLGDILHDWFSFELGMLIDEDSEELTQLEEEGDPDTETNRDCLHIDIAFLEEVYEKIPSAINSVLNDKLN